MGELLHRLYERAVQTPEHELRFLERAYESRVGGFPLRLREDFCGSALLASRWVESDDERTAVGVDHDAEVLRFADHGLDAEERARLRLVRADVTRRLETAFDVIVAMNFSWAILDDDALAAYFETARAHAEGIFVLEIFGGEELRRPRREERALDGFTYVFEQRAFDGERLDARIHFRLDDGRRFDDALPLLLRPARRSARRGDAARGGVRRGRAPRRGSPRPPRPAPSLAKAALARLPRRDVTHSRGSIT